MPFKLLGTIVLLVLVTLFCGFNLDAANRCDINLIFKTLPNVPVFMTILVSFFAGMVFMVPFLVFKKKMSKEEISRLAEKNRLEDEKSAAKNLKKLEKEKTLAEKKSAKNKTSLVADVAAKNPKDEEKTIFDLKIRRPVDKSENKNSVPKAFKDEKEV
ncbi:hypothetical protein [Treponema pectinovorum]|uniref:hypothetical protein n=1 Tax=Treponema pectinovorum TaxID=164 RepID=UPI0011CBAC2F|nr:hypothetical protein [Treponema pectinovorum]